jgi:signal transduction histidine kinase
VHHARLIGLLTITCTLLWMPADSLIYHRAREELYAVTLWRCVMVCAPLIGFLLLRRKRRFPYTVPIFAVCLSLCCGVLGYSAGLMGQLDEPWFHLYYVIFFMPVLMPWRLSLRAALTLLIPLSLWVGLLVPFPENLHSRYLPLCLSLQLCMYVLSVVFGHGLFLLNRQSFLQSRIIARNAEALKGYSATLEKLVAERTADLRRLLTDVETAREEERSHMSRELHDELGQQLAALGYEVTALQQRYAADPTGLANQVEDLAAQLEHARSTVRTLLTELRPRVLDDLGLGAAVEWLVLRAEERGNLRCQLEMTGEDVPLSFELATAVFRIAQESLTNVLRHAEASAVAVKLHITTAQVELCVRDDGKGLPPAPSVDRPGVGLIGMRERVGRLGGTIQIQGQPAGGTEVRCLLPAGGVAAPPATPGMSSNVG